ncbi:MAG: YdcF family protein [Promethearchaeota archaeon]
MTRMHQEIKEEIISSAKVIWNYLKVNQHLKKSDCIVVLGSYDLRVAEYGAKIFLEEWAPFIVFSGGLGNFTKGRWNRPEAVIFSEIAVNLGVSEEKIIIEDKSTNTGENLIFSVKALNLKGIFPDTYILIHKPYMERRTFATFKSLFPDKQCVVSSPAYSFEDSPIDEFSLEDIINIIVGDFQRIMVYPEKGYQIKQDIPDEVLSAYEFLINNHYRKHLIL